MKLRSLEEKELLRAIRKEFPRKSRHLLLGIGDDAAVIKAAAKSLLFTTDLLVEGTDFLPDLNPPWYLGRKCLNVNLSDIAAMGGRPTFALLGLGLPSRTSTAWVSQFFAGFKTAAQESKVELAGGDISRSKEISVFVALLGEGEKIVHRSGAQPGDLLFVSGYLGDAAAGLRLLRKGCLLGKDKQSDHLLRAFLDPRPRIALGSSLARRNLATSMIDISDGLSIDLLHLCEESGVGAEVSLGKLPLSPQLMTFERKPDALALHGGEDFELLFTVAPRHLDAVLRLRKRYSITQVGRITKEKRVFMIDRQGNRRFLEIKGYQHFSAAKRRSPGI